MVGDTVLSPMRDVYRPNNALSYIRKFWRCVTIKFILKPERQSYSETSSFKIQERLIEISMRNKLQLYNLEFAYQKGKSTETALLN